MPYTLSFFRCRKVKSPEYGTLGSAGIDFFIPEDLKYEDLKTSPSSIAFMPKIEYADDFKIKKIYLYANRGILIPSGIKVSIPKGHAMVFMNKSGVALKKGLAMGACVIDEDYMGEIHLHLVNTGNETVEISAGEKIAQALVIPVMHCSLHEFSSEDELFSSLRLTSERSDGGFGSTGTGI